MIEQEITIQVGESPFDTKKAKVKVPLGTKILCTNNYVLESLSLYGLNEDIDKNIQKCENEESYVARGEVVTISEDNLGNKKSALIDVDSKFTAFCSLLKEPKEIIDQLEAGMVIDVKVKTLSNGTVTASISGAITEVKFNEILNSIGDKSIKFSGKIIELINGGYWVDILGIKCFMPGSLAGLNKLWDFESLVGKTLNVIPISYSDEKNTIIVSHREYLSTLIPEAIGELNKNIKNQLNGIVTGTFKAGVFAEFNQCLTGLIPSTELDEETLERFNKNEIKPGELIQFWTKEIISNKKIILTQKGPSENVWDNIGERYKPSMVVTGTVTKITNYGAFVKLEKGVSGLIHKSKLKNILLNKGDLVNVRIQSIDFSNRKIAMALID